MTSRARDRNLILVDATPLQTVNRHHGIGSYTSNLLDALAQLMQEQEAASLALLVQHSQPDDLPVLSNLLRRPWIGSVTLRQQAWRWGRWQWVLDRLQTFARYRSIRATVKGANPRVFHATEPSGLVFAPPVTTVTTLHDLIPLHYPDAILPLHWPDIRLSYAHYLRALRQAPHIIAVSEATKADAVNRLNVPPERVTVIPQAVDPGHFYHRSDAEIDGVMNRYGLRRPYFLHVGSPLYHKNTAAVLRAFHLFLQQTREDYALCVTGAYEQQVWSRFMADYPALATSERDRVRMAGLVPGADLPALYSGAEALIYPSLIEGFGLPVLEAMRCGTAVLTSNTSSLPEVGGDAALYVDPHRVEDIAAGMYRLASKPTLRSDLAARGARRAQEFSWARTAEDTLRLYKSLM